MRSFNKEEAKQFDFINEAVNELVKIRIGNFEQRAKEVEEKFQETRNIKRIIFELRKDLKNFKTYQVLIDELKEDGIIKWSYSLDWGESVWYIYKNEEYPLYY